ncbi:MAG: PAS domain S-box protein [Desulfobacteraceae bacterium]|nr:MAG: PAS domain S-box protein [Desulfobacteraceae bacterium]
MATRAKSREELLLEIEGLRKSEARYRRLYETMMDGFAGVHMDGRLQEWNHAFRTILGYTDEELSLLTYLDLTPPKWHDFEAKILEEQVLRRGYSDVYEKEYRRKDGTTIPVELRTFLIRDETGEPSAMWAIVRDISERKRAEEELQRSEALLRSIIDQSPHALWVSDDRGTLIRMNQACRDLLHITDEEVVGKYNVLKDDIVEKQGHIPLVQRVFERGETARFILEYDTSRLRQLHLDGRASVVLDVTISAVRDPDGRVTNAVIQHIDITERRRVEEALRHAEQRYRNLFDEAPMMYVTTWDRGGVPIIADCNELFLSTIGFTRAEVVGKPLAEFYTPASRTRLEEGGYRRTLEGSFGTEERELMARDGRVVHALLRALPEKDPQGRALGTRAMFVDITEQRHAEDEREKLQAQLLQAQKMESVGRLAGGVAHDFNNMLGVVIGNAEMAALKINKDEPLYQNLQEIIKASHRSAEIVRQLLAFARKQAAIPRILDLNETVSGMLQMLKRLIGEDIDFTWMPGRDLGKIRVDPSQVNQILANLVVNSRDALPNGGKITIGTANRELDKAYCQDHPGFIPGDYVLLSVSDTGMGMSKETMRHIFDPFFTTKELGRGTGLGLATVYGVVKQNNGFINVYSEQGKGTTFRIYFPRCEGEAPAAGEKGEGRIPGGNETILIAEDEPSLLDIVRDILTKQGYTVLAAGTPAEALALSRKHPGEIHLLITDLVMPEMNGRRLADRLMLNRPGLKCLFMSGYTADVAAYHEVLNEGAHFIEKPFSPWAMAEKVRRILDGDATEP